MLASMFNVIGFSWEASPASTELEIVVLGGFLGTSSRSGQPATTAICVLIIMFPWIRLRFLLPISLDKQKIVYMANIVRLLLLRNHDTPGFCYVYPWRKRRCFREVLFLRSSAERPRKARLSDARRCTQIEHQYVREILMFCSCRRSAREGGGSPRGVFV